MGDSARAVGVNQGIYAGLLLLLDSKVFGIQIQIQIDSDPTLGWKLRLCMYLGLDLGLDKRHQPW